MAITQSGTRTVQTNSTAGTTCNPSIPGSMTASHIMVLAVVVNGNVTSTMTNPPTGWTTIVAPTLNSASSATMGVWYRFWVNGDAAPSVTWTGSAKNCGTIVPFLGVDSTTPMDVTATTGTGSSTTVISPSLTAVVMGAARLHIGGRASAGGSSTPDPRMVESTDIGTSTPNGAGVDFDYELGMAVGATGTRTTTISSASWVAASVWLRPAAPTIFGILQSKQYTSTGTATSHTVTFPNSLTSGSTIICQAGSFVTSGTQSSATYITGTNLALTKVASADEQGTTGEACSWSYQNNTNTTAATVTLNMTLASDASIIIYEIAGVTPTGTLADAVGINTALSGTAASVVSGTTTNGQKLSLAFFTASTTQASFTVDTNYVFRGQTLSATHVAFASETREIAGGGTETANMTLGTSSEWEATQVVLAADQFPASPHTPLQYTSSIYRM